MNVLLIGSGGREHALAWKLSASPLLTKLYCAPGNGGIADIAECVPLPVADHTAVIRFCADNAIDLVVVGPEAPLVAGLVDDLTTAGIKCFGPAAGGGPARRLEGLHQGSVRRIRHSDRGLWTLQGRGERQVRTWPGQKLPDRRQGRRSRRRQGRHHRHDARRSRGRDRRLLRRRVRQGGQRGRHRGIPRGRGGELLRARRRQARAGAGDGAGSQARRRRRHRPQHRRHGRLLAGPGHDAGDDRAHHARDHRADGGGHGQARHAVQGRAVRRPDDHRRGARS